MRSLIGVLGMALLIGACGSTEAVEMDTSEPWDLVWFSDSGGWGLAELWAERIEATHGVEVRVHDNAEGGLAAKTVLEFISTEGSSYAELVADAEIVVIYGNPENSGSTDDMKTCVSTRTDPRDPPVQYTAEDFEPYQDILRSIYERVFELREGNPTIVRAIDLYSPVIADWREAGIAEECTKAWETWAGVIRDTAAEFGVPTASMFDDFNGPSHDEDPREKGFIGSDGQHTNAAGRAAQLEVLDALGYEPIVP